MPPLDPADRMAAPCLRAMLALGAFSATAFAPFSFFPALLLGIAGLALMLENTSVSAAALTGWAFAFGQFLLGLHWIVYPFLVDPASHLWQLPFALTLLPAGLGLFRGRWPVLRQRLLRQRGAARLLMLAICWAAAEWLRGHVLTGFPWNLPAYGWGASPAVMQTASLVGAYGLSFLTILFGVCLAELTRRKFLAPPAMTLLFAGLWGFGALRLAEPSGEVPGVKLRLVQPDVPQTEVGLINRNWQRLLRLSLAPGNPTHIIWPEAAAHFVLTRSPTALDVIALLTAHGNVLMTGSIREPDTAKTIVWYNSLYLFAPGGRPFAVYDKTHLVPFGEYVPWPALLNPLGIAQRLIGLIPANAGRWPASLQRTRRAADDAAHLL